MPNQTMAERIPNTEYPPRVQQEEAACPVIGTVCSVETSVFCYGVDCGRLETEHRAIRRTILSLRCWYALSST